MPGKWPSTPDRKCSPASASPCASAAPPDNRFWPSCGQRKRHACSTCGLCCCVRSARSPPPVRVPHWCRPRRDSGRPACNQNGESARGIALSLQELPVQLSAPQRRRPRTGSGGPACNLNSSLACQSFQVLPIEHANNMRPFIQPCSDGFQRCPGIKLRLCCMQPQTSAPPLGTFAHACTLQWATLMAQAYAYAPAPIPIPGLWCIHQLCSRHQACAPCTR